MRPEQTDKNKIVQLVQGQNKNKIHQLFDLEYTHNGWGNGGCFIIFKHKIFHLEMSYRFFKQNSTQMNMIHLEKVEEIEDIELFIQWNNTYAERLKQTREAYNKIYNMNRKLKIKEIQCS